MPNKVKPPKSEIKTQKRFIFECGRPQLYLQSTNSRTDNLMCHTRACHQDCTSLVLWFVEAVSQAALPAVMTVKVAGHEHPGSTLVCRTLAAQPVDLAVLINLRIKTDIIKPHRGLPKLNTEHMQLAKNRMNIADK